VCIQSLYRTFRLYPQAYTRIERHVSSHCSLNCWFRMSLSWAGMVKYSKLENAGTVLVSANTLGPKRCTEQSGMRADIAAWRNKRVTTCILSRFMEWEYWRGLGWWMNLLNTYTHDTELHAITGPPLIFIIHKSTQHPLSPFPACCVFTSRSLATASNSGDCSASRAQVLSSQPPNQNSLSTD
jgi:hypothetical protein